MSPDAHVAPVTCANLGYRLAVDMVPEWVDLCHCVDGWHNWLGGGGMPNTRPSSFIPYYLREVGGSGGDLGEPLSDAFIQSITSQLHIGTELPSASRPNLQRCCLLASAHKTSIRPY